MVAVLTAGALLFVVGLLLGCSFHAAFPAGANSKALTGDRSRVDEFTDLGGEQQDNTASGAD